MNRKLPRAQAGHAGTVDVIVIGAGHAGLAMSHRLSELSIEHVVLERGLVANSWRTERWDSLRLLTPNWMTRLPGSAYVGDDPDGFMSVDDVVGFVSVYAKQCSAPVRTGTTVLSVDRCAEGYSVITDRGAWWCRAVVIASGACNQASVPAVAQAIPRSIRQVTSRQYRNPDQLADGGVLVVGASATGVQLAQEIHASGRPTTLAVGEHVRMPRRYRDRDIQWWMLASGILDEGIDDVDDPVRVRRLPSPQLAGTADHATLDLNMLTMNGVRLVGRLAGIRDGLAQFSGSLRNVCSLADLKMRRLLRAFDDWAITNSAIDEVGPIETFEPTHIAGKTPLELSLYNGEIRNIVWATGYHPDYSWLKVPVVNRKGQLIHHGGVVAAPGMYVLGLPFLRRRKSSFIHGAENDVRDLSQHLVAFLDRSVDTLAVSIAV